MGPGVGSANADEAKVVAAILDSRTPMVVIDLDRGAIASGNESAAALVGLTTAGLVGRTPPSFFEPGSSDATLQSLDLLRRGVIDSYRAPRRLLHLDGNVVAVEAWTRRVSERLAITALITRPGELREDEAEEGKHPLVTGFADEGWRVQQASAELQTVLGWDPDLVRGAALLSTMHPDDVADVLLAVESTPADAGAATVAVRMQDADGKWRRMQCVLVPLSGGGEGAPRIAFAFCEFIDDEDADDSVDRTPRAADLERHLLRIASEIRAAGLLDRLDRWPDPDKFPELQALTTRQWEVLSRLLDGERVPKIAADLYVSQSTVRNHLAAIFERFGVHSQAELLARLRS